MAGSIDQCAIRADHDDVAPPSELRAKLHDVIVCAGGKANLDGSPVRARCEDLSHTRACGALAPADVKNHPNLSASKTLSQPYHTSLLLDLPPARTLASAQNDRVQQIETIDQVEWRHQNSRVARAPTGPPIRTLL